MVRDFQYDVFISFKGSDKDGNHTEDRSIAKQLYEYLKGKGLRVFFSVGELESQDTSQSTVIIDKALDTSRILIAVGCSRENLESKRVQFEWSSFLSEIRGGFKRNNELYVVYRGMKIAELPRSLRMQQTFNVDESGAFDRLYGFIQNALDRDRYTQSPPTENDAPQTLGELAPQERKAIELALELKRLKSLEDTPSTKKSIDIAKIAFAAFGIALLFFAFQLTVRNRENHHVEASMIVSDLNIMAEEARRYASNGGTVLNNVLLNLDNKFKSPVYHQLDVEDDGRHLWWVGFDLKVAGTSRGVKRVLRQRAARYGLGSEPRSFSAQYTDQDIVWMLAHILHRSEENERVH